MKTKDQITLLLSGLAFVLLAGCASVPKQPMTKEQVLQQDDVKNKKPIVFQKGLDEVRQAGVRSLVFVGCEIKTQEPLFISGRRPNKMGLFVGSGGETVKMFFYPESEKVTHVWVDTDLSFAGIAGQQSWDDKVIGELKSLLDAPAKPQ